MLVSNILKKKMLEKKSILSEISSVQRKRKLLHTLPVYENLTYYYSYCSNGHDYVVTIKLFDSYGNRRTIWYIRGCFYTNQFTTNKLVCYIPRKQLYQILLTIKMYKVLIIHRKLKITINLLNLNTYIRYTFIFHLIHCRLRHDVWSTGEFCQLYNCTKSFIICFTIFPIIFCIWTTSHIKFDLKKSYNPNI